MKPLVSLGLAVSAVLLLRRIARPRRFDFSGRVAMISGGARGLGLGVARELARRGAKLALFSRSKIELDAAREEFERAGVRVAVRVCDVRDAVAVRDAVTAFEAELGPIDVVVNVAGVIEVGPIDALTLADYRDAVDTNLFGGIHTVEAVRERMMLRREGRIVNITSLGAKIPIPHLLPYTVSKFAFLGYSEGLRTELARYGIVVTTIVPGLMRTGSPPQATFAGQTKKEYAMFAPSDSLPFTSVSVETAARDIADACERGEVERVISWQARAAILAYALLPRTTVRFLATATRLLPDAGGSTEHRPGAESESPLTAPGSPLTAAMDRAVTQHERLDPA